MSDSDDKTIHIRVSKDDKGKYTRELMQGPYKLRDVSKVEIITMLQQFASTLRYD